MASCENCNLKVAAEKILVAQRGDEKILIGPCCAGTPEVTPQPVFDYHVEFSSRMGLLVTAEYGGLRVAFHKPAHEVQQIISKNFPGMVEAESHVSH